MSAKDPGDETPLQSSNLYRLFFDGVDAHGSYRPDGIELRLGSSSMLTHDVVWLHEIHHRALNDDTAWGAALRVTFGDPELRGTVFIDLLRACRRVHEAFATYLSVHLASAKFHNADEVLERYPGYVAAFAAMDELLADVKGAHQRDLAATAIARVCMQTPVLNWLNSASDEPQLSDIPPIDRPDVRFGVIARLGRTALGELAATADAAATSLGGITPSGYDERLEGATDVELDSLWTAWEDVVYAGLRDRLQERGAVVLARWDHIDLEAHLLTGRSGAAATRPRGSSPASDAEEAETMLRDSSFALPAASMSAQLLWCEDDVDPAEVVRVTDATTRVAGRPELVLHVRPADRVDVPPAQMVDRPGTLACLRAITASPDDEALDEVTHVALASVDAWNGVRDEWGSRGPIAACISASCLADPTWQADWFAALSDVSKIVLLDIGVEQAGSGGAKSLLPRGTPIQAAYVGLGEEALQALAVQVQDRPVLMLVLAPRVVTQLIAGQLVDIYEDAFALTGIDWGRWGQPVETVLRSLLATEAYLVQRPVRAAD